MQAGRIMQCFVYSRARLGDNHYAHPTDLLVYLDMTTREVIEILGQSKPAVIPPMSSNFVTELSLEERGERIGPKPLNISQPEGPTFTVEGNHVKWQKWNFRVGFNFREGITLHNVG
jgi:primary-amine oxidase